MKPVLVAWLVRHGLPGWLLPDYFLLAAMAALLAAMIALRLCARDGASPLHTAYAIACAYVAALGGGYLFEALHARDLRGHTTSFLTPHPFNRQPPPS